MTCRSIGNASLKAMMEIILIAILATSALIEGDAETVEWQLLDRLQMRMSDRELDNLIRHSVFQAISVRAKPEACSKR